MARSGERPSRGAPVTLRRIRIQQLGVIEEAELDLAPGLNVITGETGAGKTMVVSGLGLLLGERADAGLVRAGAARAVVEGEVDVPEDHPAARRVTEAGGDAADGLILVRSVAAEGRSRASVGGRSAPVSVLTEVGEHLVAVHGQADQWRLRSADQHRVLLDAAGGPGLAGAAQRYAAAWDNWQESRRRLHELGRTSTERSLRVGALRRALEEIEQVDPRPGEEDALRLEADRLTHAEDLRRAAQEAHEALAGADPASAATEAPSVASLLATATDALTPAAGHDEELAALLARVRELAYLATDLAPDLAAYASGVEVDPERLDAVHARRAELTGLLRRYGTSAEEVLRFAQQAAAELDEIDVSDDDLAELRARSEHLRGEVARAGQELSTLRAETARRVGEAVTEELAHLAMGSATVVVDVAHRAAGHEAGHKDRDGGSDGEDAADDGTADPATASGGEASGSTVELVDGARVRAWRHGLDVVEIRLAANPGAPARSVTRAASGGELSRVMLALELVCGAGAAPTYVFDEVDAGVGGAAALDLGARLARLARQAQVVVVTHLGQVAAYADQHLVVRKSTDGQVTSSGVVVVDGPEREAELARMLGGVADSGAALEHARELLAQRGAVGAG
ncbi:DNA repair protein RecN [Serinicoccus hydrothermalis]|uniref:DNA repair protein RecN n=1 Tax=Serinicoccus hydrothermalis TaxID=1758689 RepID=A0A1B1N816_9MICO|nr:DNA repair protein RecN [Serinicoccus hydrothermalis]ANS77561.1 DNA repair protein RecN [Serinicoccus hydrothermalis]